MPKISSKSWMIAGQERPLHVYYSSSDGFNVKSGMPADAGKYVVNAENRLRGAVTEEELNKKIRAFISEYETAIKNSRIVIVINALIHNATRELMGWDFNRMKENVLSGGHGREGMGYGFGIEFCIALEIRTGDKKEYREPNGNDCGGSAHRLMGHGRNFFRPQLKSIVIGYTQERAEFLQQIANATLGIGEQLAAFFTADEAKMVERLEGMAELGGGKQLLLN